MDIWYILWLFDTFPTVLVNCTKKNLATLLGMVREKVATVSLCIFIVT
jgi:hypothetical protein